ncbi:TetR/AcrR family transcriptional regulator [Mycetocola tolaasinivorans]|uniref:TetR/AcrR family transcriptional regulator n=1 Tax=Mycetocola tolaasinivorans TaxID=76635 RepID=A0A3L7ADM4_9MICO|nr:TetR/AcrR family transcriptional regulator [Mycetocola tolaasinivorans]RLP77900.1 TetR/AcrR family transcriptional regulator [Mycetocola tolaasinivorans]
MIASDPAHPAANLRDRKKAEMRRMLVLAAQLSLVPGGPTLEQMCADAGVSKRTFFRYFTSREDAALAPIQDQWRTFLALIPARLAEADPGASVFAVLQETLAEAIREWSAADPDWAVLTRDALALERAQSGVAAHHLGFCAGLTGEVAASITERSGAPTLRARLLFDVFLVAVRTAQYSWVSAPRITADPERLLDQLDRAVATLAPSLGLRIRVDSDVRPAEEAGIAAESGVAEETLAVG